MKTKRWRGTAAARSEAAEVMSRWAYLLSGGGAALSLGLIIVHGLAPDDFLVDSVSIGLVVIALIALTLPLIPNLAEHLVSLRLPGVEARFRQTTARAVDRAERLAEVPKVVEMLKVKQWVSQVEEVTGESDPNVRIAAAAIELERKLREVLERAGLDAPRRQMHLRGMSEFLWKRNILTDQQMELIRDVAGLRNQAVHGATVTTAEASSFERVVATLLASIGDE